MRTAFPGTSPVFQNYELVNVIWSTSPTQDPTQPQPVPLKPAGLLPSTKVANPALETYAQSSTCTDCHTLATIAPTASNKNPTLDADFSFAIGTASSPSAGTVRRSR
jgi:hypothetical protein